MVVEKLKVSKMSNNFDAWYKNADMPELVNGVWTDLEDGLTFNRATNYAPTELPRKKTSPATSTARAAAAKFGGKALTGTKAQKEWAEKIRAEILGKVTSDQAEILVRRFPTSKFWIENRATPNIGAAAVEADALYKQSHALYKQAEAELVCDGQVIKSYGRYHEIMAERGKVWDRLEEILVLPKD